jgi:hypothetical protein
LAARGPDNQGKREAPPAQINVVLNRFEELKQKVPAGKK